MDAIELYYITIPKTRSVLYFVFLTFHEAACPALIQAQLQPSRTLKHNAHVREQARRGGSEVPQRIPW